MIRLLVAAGCSCTAGWELADRDAESWPAVLADLFDLDVVNLGRGGASNRKIVRTVVSELPDLITDRGRRPSEVIVIPAWTEVVRHEYYRRPSRAEARAMTRRYGRPRPGAGWRPIQPALRDQGDPASVAFYEHLWSDEGQISNLLLDWVMFDRWLVALGVLARYAFAFPLPGAVPSVAEPLLAQVPGELTFGGIPPRPGTAFLPMTRKMERGPGGHPLQAGHALFAGELHEWLLRDDAFREGLALQGLIHRDDRNQLAARARSRRLNRAAERIGALTQLFNEVRPEATPEIVEKVVHEIDAVASGVHPPPGPTQATPVNWQTSREGVRLVKQAIRAALKKYGLPPTGDLFDRAYIYVAEHYWQH